MAVAIKVHGILQIARRHELRLAERTGPGAHHARGRDIATVDDLQRIDQLGAKHLLAGRHIGFCGQHIDDGMRQLGSAETGFAAPDRNDDITRHTVFRLYPAQRRPVGGSKRTPGSGKTLQPLFREIGAGRAKFRLALALLLWRLLAGNDEIGQGPADGETAERGLKRLL